jgi:hypothetical protein
VSAQDESKAVTIPGKLVRFLEQHANLGFAGTRDRHLVPYGHRVSGWRVGADGRTLTALIAEHFTDRLLESLQDNGQFAVTIEDYPAHETYQFKGKYLRHRPLQRDDSEIVDAIRQRFVRSIRPLYPLGPDQLGPAYAFIHQACLAVDFEVHEIYVQTPGPQAGSRLVPPAET